MKKVLKMACFIAKKRRIPRFGTMPLLILFFTGNDRGVVIQCSYKPLDRHTRRNGNETKNMRLAGILACLLALSCAGCGVQGGLPDGSAAGEPQQKRRRKPRPPGGPGGGENGAVPKRPTAAWCPRRWGGRWTLIWTAMEQPIPCRSPSDRWSGGRREHLDRVCAGQHCYQWKRAGGDRRGKIPWRPIRYIWKSPDRDHYFITDLDTGDKALEIALLDYGPSDDPMTWYFQYRNGALKLIGSLPGFPDDEGSHRDGSGNVMAVGPPEPAPDLERHLPYTLKDGTLAEVAQSQYVPPSGAGRSSGTEAEADHLCQAGSGGGHGDRGAVGGTGDFPRLPTTGIGCRCGRQRGPKGGFT